MSQRSFLLEPFLESWLGASVATCTCSYNIAIDLWFVQHVLNWLAWFCVMWATQVSSFKSNAFFKHMSFTCLIQTIYYNPSVAQLAIISLLWSIVTLLNWLVVSTPLKNMSSSVRMIIPNWMEKKNVPNHQLEKNRLTKFSNHKSIMIHCYTTSIT